MDRIEHLRKRAPQSDLPGYIRLSDEQGAVKIIEEKCGLNEEEKTQLIRTLHWIADDVLSELGWIRGDLKWTETKRQLKALEEAAKKLQKATWLDRNAQDIFERACLSLKGGAELLQLRELRAHLKVLIEAAGVARTVENPGRDRTDSQIGVVQGEWFRELAVIWELFTDKIPSINWDGMWGEYRDGDGFVDFVKCSAIEIDLRSFDPSKTTFHDLTKTTPKWTRILPRVPWAMSPTGLPKSIQIALGDKSALAETRKQYGL